MCKPVVPIPSSPIPKVFKTNETTFCIQKNLLGIVSLSKIRPEQQVLFGVYNFIGAKRLDYVNSGALIRNSTFLMGKINKILFNT